MDLSWCVQGPRWGGATDLKCVLLLVVLTSWLTWHRAGVSCAVLESCMLPCTFPPGDDLIIHWIHLMARDVYVHSYYKNQDQLDHQDQCYRNRTSLFKSQISRGNASLLLRGVEVQDQGRYKCYTSTSSSRQHSIMNLKVDVPVHKVDIQQVADEITCSSKGIYPKPELTWSTRTLETTRTLKSNSSVQQSEQQLYSIRSSQVFADQNYSCTVSTPTSQRRATWFLPTSINSSNSEVTISCTSTKTPLKGLIWRFNLRDLILDQTRTNTVWGDGWRQKVEHVSESGSLTLRPPLQEGMYTCEVSDDEETYITNSILRVHPGSRVYLVAGIAAGLAGIQVVVVVLVFCCKKTRSCCCISDKKREIRDKEREEDEKEVKVPLHRDDPSLLRGRPPHPEFICPAEIFPNHNNKLRIKPPNYGWSCHHELPPPTCCHQTPKAAGTTESGLHHVPAKKALPV